jgi:hypothetical protein
MKKFAAFVGVSVLASAATTASAADPYGYHDRGYDDSGYGFYLGASVGSILYKEDQLDTIRPTVLEFRIGQQFNPFIAIEGRFGGSIGTGDWHNYRVDAEWIWGGYVKGILPTGPIFSLYGLAGVDGVQWHRNYPDFHSNDAGLSFGAGGEFNLGGGASLNLEWLRLAHATNDTFFDYTADQVTFGVIWKF